MGKMPHTLPSVPKMPHLENTLQLHIAHTAIDTHSALPWRLYIYSSPPQDVSLSHSVHRLYILVYLICPPQTITMISVSLFLLGLIVVVAEGSSRNKHGAVVISNISAVKPEVASSAIAQTL